jgi:hypothetical protein
MEMHRRGKLTLLIQGELWVCTLNHKNKSVKAKLTKLGITIYISVHPNSQY